MMSADEKTPRSPAAGGAARPISVMVEWVSVAVIFFVYLFLQINAIQHGNYAGQDFQRNKTIIVESSEDPLKALTHPVYVGRGFPTLYHFLAGRIYLLAGKNHYLPVLAYCNLGLNVIALGLFYMLVQRIIHSAVIRISWLAWTAFLPIVVICSTVIASDAATGICFVLILWLNILALDSARSFRTSFLLMTVLAVLLVVTVMIKMNYAMCVGGELLGIILLWAARMLPLRRLILGLVLLVVVPTVASFALYKAYLQKQITTSASMDRKRFPPEVVQMSLRSFLFFRPTDLQLLNAPYFHELKYTTKGFVRPLHINNYYSYPGMLPLGVFTDFLNIYQPIVFASNFPGIIDEYYTRVRPPENKTRMQWALKLGLIFYFAGFILIPWLVISVFIRALFIKQLNESDRELTILAAISCFLYAGTVIYIFLFFDWPYVNGGWLPRFYWAPLIGLFMLLFITLERVVVRKFQVFRWVILAVVLAQTALNISFLWVHGSGTVFPSVDIVEQSDNDLQYLY